MTPIADSNVAKISALVLASIALLDEPAHVDRGSRPSDCWHDVRLVADSDGAYADLTVRAPYKAKGLWIIEVGRYGDGMNLRKRDIAAINPADLAALFKTCLVAARQQRKASASASKWQVVADRINAGAPKCGLKVIAAPSGLRLRAFDDVPVTAEQATTLMNMATMLGVVGS
jgi:hypothetical protein